MGMDLEKEKMGKQRKKEEVKKIEEEKAGREKKKVGERMDE